MAFPLLSSGALTQFPFTLKRRTIQAHCDMESGLRYSYYWDAADLVGWDLVYSCITDAERNALKAFWDSVGGSWDTFSFTDPQTAVVYPYCRFDGDEFTYQQLGPDQNSLKLSIVEFRP